MLAVRPDHDAPVGGQFRAILAVPADAGHLPVCAQNFVHHKIFDQLHPHRAGRIHQDLVQHKAARGDGDHLIHGRQGGAQRKIALIVRPLTDGRAAALQHAFQQPPFLEQLDPWVFND